jgi:hypothetical protein
VGPNRRSTRCCGSLGNPPTRTRLSGIYPLVR